MEIGEKHVLVTGAGKRIGRTLAEAFLSMGAKLSAHYHTSANEVAYLTSPNVFPIQADLANTDEVASSVSRAVEHFGPVEILINSASIFYPTPTLEVTSEQWDRFQDVNLRGQFFFCQQVAKHLFKAKRRGVILNIADVNGQRPIRSHAPYTVSKAGLLMLTRNLAKEWAPLIRVNSISPGAVLLPESYGEKERNASIERSLLKRLGSPEDIVAAAKFLIENDYVTGFDLRVDGGRSLQ